MRGCSSSEVGSVTAYTGKVTMSWVFIRVIFEVAKTVPVFIRP